MKALTFLRGQWDRAAAWVFAGIGVLVLALGYDGVSHTGLVAEQIPYVVSGGMFGLLLVGVGGVLWLSADLRDEWCKLDDLETVLTKIEAKLPEPSSEPGPRSAEAGARSNGHRHTNAAPSAPSEASTETIPSVPARASRARTSVSATRAPR